MENSFNGDPYLKIPDPLVGAIINSKNLLTYEGKIFMVILFKTVGFQKEKDWLTYKQICKHTGIKYKTRISESIKSLVEKYLIKKEGKYFKVNQDFEKWQTLERVDKGSLREIYQPKKLQNNVTNDNEKLRNSVTPSTDNIITDKINTDNISKHILSFWNSKEIVKHKETKDLLDRIKAAVKKYGKDNILKAIEYYSLIYKDKKYFYDNIWRLDNFLKQRNGVSSFLDDGQVWMNYVKDNEDKVAIADAIKKEEQWNQIKEKREEEVFVRKPIPEDVKKKWEETKKRLGILTKRARGQVAYQ